MKAFLGIIIGMVIAVGAYILIYLKQEDSDEVSITTKEVRGKWISSLRIGNRVIQEISDSSFHKSQESRSVLARIYLDEYDGKFAEVERYLFDKKDNKR